MSSGLLLHRHPERAGSIFPSSPSSQALQPSPNQLFHHGKDLPNSQAPRTALRFSRGSLPGVKEKERRSHCFPLKANRRGPSPTHCVPVTLWRGGR